MKEIKKEYLAAKCDMSSSENSLSAAAVYMRIKKGIRAQLRFTSCDTTYYNCKK